MAKFVKKIKKEKKSPIAMTKQETADATTCSIQQIFVFQFFFLKKSFSLATTKTKFHGQPDYFLTKKNNFLRHLSKVHHKMNPGCSSTHTK